MTPQELVDKYNAVIAQDLTDLGLSYDLFTRTTTRNHYAVVQEMFRQVHANGYMIEQTTRGAISPSTGRTLPDRYIEGTCPICGFPEARGDQCDNCGNQLDADELINPRSKINGETPEFIETQHFFLDLPALAAALGEWLDGREASGTWRPNVIKFSKNLLKDVRPRAMTRDIDWGIPIPLEGWEDNPASASTSGSTPSSATSRHRSSGPAASATPERWREWWNDPTAVSYYFQGKDNITFHSQIWPAELLGYAGKGDKGGEPGAYGELNLPTEVVASEFMTLEGKQFSTSRKHVIYVQDIVARYGPDPIRYFICAAGPENQDADFTWAEFVQRNNSELVAGWGNLVNRTAAMIAKSFGEIPRAYAVEPVDEELLATVRGRSRPSGASLERHRQKAALAEVMRVVGEANAYVSKTEPFKLKGDDERERLSTVLHTLVQAVSDINTLISPFLPHAANRVHAVLGGEGEFMPMPRLEVVRDLDDDSRATPSSPASTPRRRAGSRGPSSSARPSPSRPVSSSSSTPSRSSRTSGPASATRPRRHAASPDPRRAEDGTPGRPSAERPDRMTPHASGQRGLPEHLPDPLPIDVVDNHVHLDITREGDEPFDVADAIKRGRARSA